VLAPDKFPVDMKASNSSFAEFVESAGELILAIANPESAQEPEASRFRSGSEAAVELPSEPPSRRSWIGASVSSPARYSATARFSGPPPSLSPRWPQSIFCAGGAGAAPTLLTRHANGWSVRVDCVSGMAMWSWCSPARAATPSWEQPQTLPQWQSQYGRAFFDSIDPSQTSSFREPRDSTSTTGLVQMTDLTLTDEI